MITLTSKTKDFAINLPTNFEEITPEYLTNITSNIKLAEHYSIVAICKHVDIAQFILANTGNKNANTLVNYTAILAKGSKDSPIGSKLLIDKQGLDYSQTIYINTAISDNFVFNYIESDPDMRKALITNLKSCKVYLLSFKLVPNSSIHGYVIGDLDINKDNFYRTAADKSMNIPFTGK